jgi:hypothetical protein
MELQARRKAAEGTTYRISCASVLLDRHKQLARVFFLASGCHGCECGAIVRARRMGCWGVDGQRSQQSWGMSALSDSLGLGAPELRSAAFIWHTPQSLRRHCPFSAYPCATHFCRLRVHQEKQRQYRNYCALPNAYRLSRALLYWQPRWEVLRAPAQRRLKAPRLGCFPPPKPTAFAQ